MMIRRTTDETSPLRRNQIHPACNHLNQHVCRTPSNRVGVELAFFKLVAISQMPQENYTTSKVKHPEKVLSVSFIPANQSAEVL
jgi:hypothetical protein